MSQLLGSSFKLSIVGQIKKCTRSITIISPYVTVPAVKELVKSLPAIVKKRCLVTVPPGVEYVNGSVDVAALEFLSQHGFEIRWLADLHAKIYLLDEKVAFVGSANFTKSGWELDNKGNVEDMVMLEMSKNDRDHITTRYIKSSVILGLNGNWKNDVEKYKAAFQKQYEKLIDSIVINYHTQEFIMYSDYVSPPNGYKYHFRFTLSKTTGVKLKKEKKGIHLKWGGDEAPKFAGMRRLAQDDTICGADATSIVSNLDLVDGVGRDDDFNGGGTGVDGVVYQLLDYCRWRYEKDRRLKLP